jgi:hypothetical protein
MMKFYRQETSRILAFLKFLSTTCVTLRCGLAIPFSTKELTDGQRRGWLEGQGFWRQGIVENLRKDEEKASPARQGAESWGCGA